MPEGLFEVEVMTDGNAPSNTVRVRASSADEAASKVAALGSVVGSVQLVQVLESPKTRDKEEIQALEVRELSNQSNLALLCSGLGMLVCGPLALFGLIWGMGIKDKSNGKFGTGAVVFGSIGVGLWVLLVIIYMANL